MGERIDCVLADEGLKCADRHRDLSGAKYV
jgi:hypothetical protein